MIAFSESITISRPSADVFAFVADMNNIPKWQSEVVSSRVITPGPTKVGTRFTEDVKMGPTRTTAACEVTEFSPGSSMAFKAISQRMDYEGSIGVESVAGASRLTMKGSAQMKGWWRLMEPLMKREFQNGIRKELGTLKAVLESGMAS